MSVKINYKNNKIPNNAKNIVLFTDENFEISRIKKYISGSDFDFISDLLKTKDIKKKNN